jgi:hypothetical protein
VQRTVHTPDGRVLAVGWLRRAAVIAAVGVASVAVVTATAPPGQASQTSTLAQVPWAKVGPGWELAEETAASALPPRSEKAPTRLYLLNPSGGKYPLYTWAAGQQAPYLIAWSGDKTRALLGATSGTGTEQLTLASGKITSFTLPGQAEPIGYTRPDGLNILGLTETGTATRYARYSLAGKLVKVLATVPGDGGGAVYQSVGAGIAVGSASGVDLLGNAGGIIRKLTVPHTSRAGCTAARWWTSSVVLASCLASGGDEPRLWLVPVTGGQPAALTRQRGSDGPDLGDIGAWKLPGGLYLQALGACGTVQIFRQAANGSIAAVKVPGTTQNDNRIVTVVGPRMLINAQTSCPGSQSLLWFTPATRAEQWLLRTPADEAGVEAVVPYYSTQNAA